jgi:hypothetical protein
VAIQEMKDRGGDPWIAASAFSLLAMTALSQGLLLLKYQIYNIYF